MNRTEYGESQGRVQVAEVVELVTPTTPFLPPRRFPALP